MKASFGSVPHEIVASGLKAGTVFRMDSQPSDTHDDESVIEGWRYWHEICITTIIVFSAPPPDA